MFNTVFVVNCLVKIIIFAAKTSFLFMFTAYSIYVYCLFSFCLRFYFIMLNFEHKCQTIWHLSCIIFIWSGANFSEIFRKQFKIKLIRTESYSQKIISL